MSKSITINGYTFRLTPALGVAVVGPGLPFNGGFGIQITSDVDNLSLNSVQGLANIPGVSPEAASALAAITLSDIAAIKELAVPTPPAPEPPVVTKPEPPKEDPVVKQAEAAAPPAVNTNPATDTPVTAEQAKPADNLVNDDNPEAVSVNAAGQNIGLSVRDETGALSNLRRNPETGELYNPGNIARNPASTTNSSQNASVSGALNNNTKRLITPQPNVLDNFSSYTYQASVYLMTPDQYTSLIRSTKKSINGYYLLFQSGGAPNNSGGFQGALSDQVAATQADLENEGIGFAPTIPVPPAVGQTSAGRNPAFPLDFYIDSISMTNLIQGRSTGIAHNVNSLKFTVTEPAGITLIDRMYQAVQDASPKGGAGSVNYSAAQYLMVIRWFGYDENGKLITGGSGANPQAGLTNPDAVIEKFIPFQINSIGFQVGSRVVTYEFECTPVGQMVAGGTRRGTVPYDVQLSEGTVGGILSGTTVITSDTSSTTPTAGVAQDPANQTAAAQQRTGVTVNSQGRTNNPRAPGNRSAAVQQSAPPKADAAPSSRKTIKNGLAGALTEFNQDLTRGARQIYEQADEYEIVFASGAEEIRDAKLTLPGKPEASQAAMSAPPTADPKSASTKTGGKDTTIKSISIVAGQPVVQVIDTIIRNSSYVTDQAVTKIDAATNEEVGNSDVKNKTVKWYRINFEAIPKQPYDKLRNDYAYKIRYIISAYTIDKYDSKYFPVGQFRGVHKSYPWWFTGENLSIIDYNEKISNSYTQLVSGSNPSDSLAETERRKVLATLREQTTYTYSPRSEQSSQGSRAKGLEVSANLADSLYSPGDLGNVDVRIVGDPGWIQQGSLAGGVSVEEFNGGSFLPDGTINFDAEQVFFEVNYNRPQDYNVETGLIDGANDPINKNVTQNISRVFQATEVVSDFRGGKFEQTIKGNLWLIPKPDGSNKAPDVPQPTKTEERDDGSYNRLENRRFSTPRTTAEQAVIAKNAPPGQTNVVGGRLVTNTAGGAAIVHPRAGRRGTVPAATAPLPTNDDVANPPWWAKNNTAPAQTNPVGASSNGQNVSLLDRILNRIAGQKISQPQKIAQD